MAATEKFDMIPVREKQQFDPQPWDGSEMSLPGKLEDGGYFLKAGAGEKWSVGGTVVRPLATRKEAADRFSIYDISGSSANGGFGKTLKFEETHHAVFTVEGVLKLEVEGEEVKTTAGETTFVPAGAKWKLGFESVYARAYIFANGGGLGEVLTSVGSKYEEAVVGGSEVGSLNEGQLKSLEGELKFIVS